MGYLFLIYPFGVANSPAGAKSGSAGSGNFSRWFDSVETTSTRVVRYCCTVLTVLFCPRNHEKVFPDFSRFFTKNVQVLALNRRFSAVKRLITRVKQN